MVIDRDKYMTRTKAEYAASLQLGFSRHLQTDIVIV